MSSKIDPKDLKAPDTFHTVSDKLFEVIEKNAAAIVGIVGLALLIGIGYITYGYVQTRAEKNAAEALFAPQEDLRKAEEKAQPESQTNLANKLKTAAAATPRVDFKTTYAPLVERLKNELLKVSNTRAALASAVSLSAWLMEQKQFPEALNVLTIPTYRPGDADVANGLLLMHRGLAELEIQKSDEAIADFSRVTMIAGQKSFHAEALLKLGLAFEQKGDAAKARETYQRLGREFPDSEAFATAQTYLRLLDLKSQQG